MIEHLEHPELQIGVPVEKFSGDARWEGIIVARYRTLSGKLRFAVEVLPQGFQMITTGPLLRLKPPVDHLSWIARDSASHAKGWEDAYDPDEPSPRQGYTIQKGDTLGSIALLFYNRSHLWPLIAHANRVMGTSDLTPGNTLWIPSRQGKRRVPT